MTEPIWENDREILESFIFKFGEYKRKYEELKNAVVKEANYENRLFHLRTVTDAIKVAYEEADDDLKRIIELRFWKKQSLLEITDELFLTKTKVKGKIDIFITNMAKHMGWIM